MSVRRPFTRGGRHLTLVRPRPPVPPKPLAQFWQMLLRPAAGVALVLRSDPGLLRLALGLAVVGLLRGVVEGLWYYLMTGRTHELLSLIGRAEWYTRYGGPFLLVNIPSAHFLWFTTAIIFHLGCRTLGGQGSFRQVLQVTGIAMYAYVAIGLINYLHLLVPLPSVTLEASAFYRPSLGVGQLVVFVWLGAVLYQAARQVHGLPVLEAVATAPLPILVCLLLYLASAGFFFRLVPLLLPGDWHPNESFGGAHR